MAGGAVGLAQAGRRPDLTVSHALKKLSAETRKLAEYGYDPAQLNTLMNQIEKSRGDVMRSVASRGGSASEVNYKLGSALEKTLDSKAKVMFQDAQEKARKWGDVMRTDMAKAGQEFDLQKLNLANWYKDQEMWGSLLSSGIGNIIGARQYKETQDTLREIGSPNPFIRK